ncbi:DNA polymerase [Roseiconus lacunae]|uniref:DNA polymerase n=1 Tax=Roseiconus lacunae TaxID=2605694 RepID=UPI001E39374D|nr:DNA polymerase [Roseiconus lacunae]MCD0458655.1 DNA polymerase [Roseiconus lacunae]
MVAEVIEALRQQGLTVSFDGVNLVLEGAVDTLDASLKDAVKRQKTLLMSQLAPPVYFGAQPLHCESAGAIRFVLVAWFDSRVVVWSPHLERDQLEETVRSSPSFGGAGIKVVCATCPSIPPIFEQMAAVGRRFCVHDVRRAFRLTNGALPLDVQWIDTADICRAAGYPSDIQKLVTSTPLPFHETVKLRFGQKPSSRQHRSLHDDLVGGAARSIATQNLFEILSGFYDPVAAWGHHRINNRGVCVDVQLAKNLHAIWTQSYSQVMKPIQDGTAGISPADLRNDAKFSIWLRTHGLAVTKFNRDELSRLLHTIESGSMSFSPAVLHVVQAKLFLLRPLGSQLQTMLDICDADGRLRHQFVSVGSHTGRFASDESQLHNFQRPDVRIANHSSLISRSSDPHNFLTCLPPGVRPDDAVASLRRFCLIAEQGNRLCIGDFRSIEPRVLAWCADEPRLLEAFREGRDPYVEMAERLFGRRLGKHDDLERQVGKVVLLGAGYAMGAETFDDFAGKHGVDLASVGLRADMVIQTFRSEYPRICGNGEINGMGLWYAVDAAARHSVATGAVTHAGRCEFHHDGSTLFIRLPSGRWLCYRNLYLECADSCGQASLRFDHPKNGRVNTWGGKLTENIVQAIVSDLLIASLVRCEQSGLAVVMHVHDEIVVEAKIESAESTCAELSNIMESPPDWARDVPLEAKTRISSRHGDG